MGERRGPPLHGRRVVTTRDTPGRLDRMLAELGAVVLHAPLIAIEPLEFGAIALADVLARSAARGAPAWLVVTSQHGASAAGPLVRERPHVRLAAVGTRTAEVLAEAAGRPVDRVPPRQTAADLVAEFPRAFQNGALAVVLQGDLAEPTLVEGLRAKGYLVEARTAYRTITQPPDADIRAALLAADAITFASGSAARAWAAAVGPATPPAVVAIGPTTEAVARSAGIAVTHVAATHDLEGLAAAVVDALGPAT